MLIAEKREVGYSTVKTIVREIRRAAAEVFVPLEHQPGDLAQADFFEVLVDIGGVRSKARIFLLRLTHSGRDFARISERQDQVSFLDALVRALRRFAITTASKPASPVRVKVTTRAASRRAAARFVFSIGRRMI